MFKTLALAMGAVLLVGAEAAAADSDTRPEFAGIRECDGPKNPTDGHIRFVFKVTAAGAIEDVRVEQSSGDPEADAKATKCAAGLIFKPATHNGVPVDGIAHFNYNFGTRITDMAEGPRKAFHVLERDADRRCQKLYPINIRFDLTGQPITLVTVARLKSGEIQTKITQSAGETADANAVKCITQMVREHDDLPAEFVRTISVDWSHRAR